MFVVLGLACAAPASAQEIVVTLERRAQTGDEVASNAAALAAAELARIAAQAPSEALNRLPGVAIHRNNGVENLPAIRSPVLVGNQSAGSFLVLEDGVPIRAPGFANVNQLFETSLDFAERIEVVRGPGSALYGSNAVHGLVNVITATPPGENDRRLEASAEGGGFGRAAARLLVRRRGTRQCYGIADDSVTCGPPSSSVVAAVSAEHGGEWREQASLDRQQGMLGWDVMLGDWRLESRVAFQNLNQESAGFIQGPEAYKDSALSRMNPAPEAYRDTQIARGRVTLERDIGDALTLRLTPYARWIDADLNLFFFPSRAQELTEQAGGGLQASLYWDPRDDVSLIVGADVDQTRGSLWENQTLPDQPNGYLQGLHYDYDVDMRVLAAYAQARWAFAPDWAVIAGVRGESVRYEYDNNTADADFGRFRRPADRVDEFDAVTPKLGIVWNPAARQTLWLNLARGARPPQITDLYSLQTTQTPGAQDVETIDSAELGWRGEMGDASFEVALYHMDKRDTSFRNADGFTVTDGRTRHQGVELSGVVPLSEQVTLAGWITYARHTYRFNDTVARAGESIASGDDVDSAPRWIWNARLAWAPTESFEAELEWVHMGEYFTNASNTAAYDGHDVLNLRASWRLNADVSVFGAVRNVTNKDYAERADFAFGADRYFPGEDRAVTLGVALRR